MPTTDDDDDKAARIFCHETIERLATIAKFPADADLEIFARFIRNAAYFYFQDTRLSSPSKLKKEIVALHRAAEKREYDRVSTLLQELSPLARMASNVRNFARFNYRHVTTYEMSIAAMRLVTL